MEIKNPSFKIEKIHTFGKNFKINFLNYHRILRKVIVSSSCHRVQLNKIVKVGYFSVHPFLKDRKKDTVEVIYQRYHYC